MFEECHRTGAPILRPLLFEFPDDAATYTADDEFLLGGGLLMAPITRPGIEHRHVYLPGRDVGALVDRRAVDGPGARARARAARAARRCTRAPTRRSRSALPCTPASQPDGLTLARLGRPRRLGRRSTLYEDAGDGYGPSARTGHVESGDDGIVRFSLSARKLVRTDACARRVDLGGEPVEVAEASEPVVIER